MLKIILTVGIPASGKSSWTKTEISKDPDNWLRINNDDIRAMANGSNYSSQYENMITNIRRYLIQEGLKQNKNIIIDNLNLNKRHFEDACNIAKSSGKDVQVLEKLFFIDLDEAIERDSKREGKSKVGEDVIKKWWKDSGGKQFKFTNPKVEVFTKEAQMYEEPIIANANLEDGIMCDLDGTTSLFNVRKKDGTIEIRYPGAHIRDPYDASNCDEDSINPMVAEAVKLFQGAGKHIIFCSGRENKYEEPTVRFLNKHFPNMPYVLHMRKSGDFRKDSIVKSEMYENKIKPKYNIKLCIDDREQVVNYYRSLGLTVWQVAEGKF